MKKSYDTITQVSRQSSSGCAGNAFFGWDVRHCRHIGEISYAWLKAIEEGNHSEDWITGRRSTAHFAV